MSKKDKQPRGNDRRFVKQTPMIELHAQNGSTAYFSSVEEMEKFTGSKIEFKNKEEKNPDCETATKGYVKCLMRKTRQHTHDSTWDGKITLLLMMAGWLTTTILGVCCFSLNKNSQNFGNQYFVSMLLFSIVMTCIYHEFMNVNIKGINESTPSELEKYTAPTCEKKDECN